jgi:Poxvirus A32 protein
MTRERHFNLVAGGTGCGKSTWLANKVIKPYTQNVIVLKHIVNVNDKAFSFLPKKTIETFKKYNQKNKPIQCVIPYTDKKEYKPFLEWVKNNIEHCLLIIDDATILEKDRLSETMQLLATMRRHYAIDIYLVYHGLTFLPIDQFIHVNYLIMFNTSDNFIYKAKKLPNSEVLKNAQAEVKKNYLSKDKQYVPVIINIKKMQ